MKHNRNSKPKANRFVGKLPTVDHSRDGCEDLPTGMESQYKLSPDALINLDAQAANDRAMIRAWKE